MQLYLKDKKRNNLYIVQKYAHLLVLGHYLFLKPHIFLQALLLENCLHLKQVVSEDKYPCIFLHQRETIVCILTTLCGSSE